jgi:hypothetical protein
VFRVDPETGTASLERTLLRDATALPLADAATLPFPGGWVTSDGSLYLCDAGPRDMTSPGEECQPGAGIIWRVRTDDVQATRRWPARFARVGAARNARFRGAPTPVLASVAALVVGFALVVYYRRSRRG